MDMKKYYWNKLKDEENGQAINKDIAPVTLKEGQEQELSHNKQKILVNAKFYTSLVLDGKKVQLEQKRLSLNLTTCSQRKQGLYMTGVPY